MTSSTASSGLSSPTLMPLVPPIVLLGPPGAGKSTVGPVLAARLGFAFIDLDVAVGVEHLQSEGLASFRVREFLALEAALDRGAVVVAAGAGITDTAPAVARLRRCLCLAIDVDATTALARMADATRPWLPNRGHPDRTRAYVEREEGRAARRAALAAAAVDGRAAVAVVVAACEAAVAGVGIGEEAAAEGDEGAVIPDGFRVVDARSGAEGDVVVDVSDAKKRLALVEELLTAFVRAGVRRDDLIVGVGGGVLLDVVGLAASLHHRGTRWHAVPTTLLAMVDAALGGKTAVDMVVDGVVVRNAAGAFHPPVGCTLDLGFLRTLGKDAVRQGRAEITKHALLQGAPLDVAPVTPLDVAAVVKSRRVKRFVVARDPHERHFRHALNLGHTFAHAFESRFGFAHGDAVWHGLRAALHVSVEVAGFDRALATSLRKSLALTEGGPRLVIDEGAVEPLLQTMARDKKPGQTPTELRLILLRAPGCPVLARVPRDVVKAALIHAHQP